MEFQQSKTYSNLQKAYERDLMISTLYSIYSNTARTEQFIEISNLYETYTRNVREHARIFLRQLNNGTLPDTMQNLLTSSEIALQTADLFREYADTALTEGFTDLSALFSGIANIELNHNLALSLQYGNMVRDEVFCKPADTLWICQQCGNIMGGRCAPNICPVCGFPQGYYRVYDEACTE